MLIDRSVTILIAVCSLFGSLDAGTSSKTRICIKMRIEKSSVRVMNDGFAVITKKGILKTKALRSDAAGLYVLNKDLYAKKGEIDWPGYHDYYRCDTCHLVFNESDAKKHAEKKGHKQFHRIENYH
jgi:hypothetical protein